MLSTGGGILVSCRESSRDQAMRTSAIMPGVWLGHRRTGPVIANTWLLPEFDHLTGARPRGLFSVHHHSAREVRRSDIFERRDAAAPRS
jgi:hypothetical protein